MKINSKEIFTISNSLSFLRLLLVVPFWLLFNNFYDGSTRYIIFGLCLFAALTDILDGFLARKLNQVTEFGKIIDPLADKAAMAVVVIRLFMLGEIPSEYLFIIIIRDLLIFFGGLYVSNKLGRVLPSNMLGKITVLVLGIVVLLILIGIDKSSLIFNSIYYLSIVLLFTSFAGYVIRASEFIKKKNAAV